jgi:hypothetical protein
MPAEGESPSTDIVTSRTRRIQELEAEKQKLNALLRRDRLVRSGSEHRHLLKEALTSAQRMVIITSPKIKQVAYRGDKGFLKEGGMYSENPKIVKEVAEDVLKRFKSAS